ncbi:hypothetical protein SLS60_003904 [Paraconiothyrium brasiliense]|uniref:Uncharacterized protein n=1 Tax=Paraconiothyrium brasiliense TaxID=300254 RepID=A0ABR3RPZ6_9PLEO
MTSYAPSTTTRSSFDSIDMMKSGKTTSSVSLVSSPDSAKTPSKTRQAWEFIKKHAKEHHESVNAAYATYYGQGAMRPVQKTEKP